MRLLLSGLVIVLIVLLWTVSSLLSLGGVGSSSWVLLVVMLSIRLSSLNRVSRCVLLVLSLDLRTLR